MRNNTLRTVLLQTGTDLWHIETFGESGRITSVLMHGTGNGDGFWSYSLSLAGTQSPLKQGMHALLQRSVLRCTAKAVAQAHAEAELPGRALFARLTGATVAP